MITSFTDSLEMFARLMDSSMTMAPSFGAGMELNAPPNEPMGVRQALTMTTSFMSNFPSFSP
jgi:hypothetical protein